MPTDPVYPESLEPMEFWDEHKTKILIYGGLLIIVLAGYGIFALTSYQKRTAAAAAYAEATTAANFQQVARDYSGTVTAGNADLRLADKLRDEKKYDEALGTLRDFIAKSPEHPLASGAWTSLASTYELQGKVDEAIDAYQQAATKFPSAYTTPLAMNSQARLLAQKGKKEEAQRLYQDVAARYPESVFAREAMRELRFLKR